MLFALEWIRDAVNNAANFLEDVLSKISINSLTSLFTQNFASALLVLVCGVILCIWGFKGYKIVDGVFGALLFGYLGYITGTSIPFESIVGPILFTVVFAVIGYFFFYFINVIPDFLFGFIVTIVAGSVLGINLFWVGVLIAIIVGIGTAYITAKFRFYAISIYGGILLFLVMYGYVAWTISLILALCITVGGIPIQRYLKKGAEKSDSEN